MTTSTTHSHARDYKAETIALRYIADGLALPALCRNNGCRRTRACKGEPRDCLSRFAPLVPEDAREWMKAVIGGLWDDRAFEEVFADHQSEFAAYAAWREAVEHAYA
jgi:hypothetical protein